MGPSLNANMYPEVFQGLGIDTGNLGCIMIDVAPFQVVDLVINGENDIYQTPDPVNHPYTGGAPAESAAHCTLLYGLLASGQKWQPYVDAVLDSWEIPDLTISGVTAFPSNQPGEDYAVIVAEVVKTPELDEGHKRLRMLPHCDTFPEYNPHITLAYIAGPNDPSDVDWADSIQDKWIQSLNVHLAGRTFDAVGLNYGGD